MSFQHASFNLFSVQTIWDHCFYRSYCKTLHLLRSKVFILEYIYRFCLIQLSSLSPFIKSLTGCFTQVVVLFKQVSCKHQFSRFCIIYIYLIHINIIVQIYIYIYAQLRVKVSMVTSRTHTCTRTHIHTHTYTHIHGVQEKCFVHQSLQFFSNFPNLERINITVYHSLTEINNCCNHYTIFW